MSLLCAAFVVVIHLGIPKDCLMYRFLVRGVASIAVPFFFVVSGFFLSAHFEEEGWWKRETVKRLSSLVVPFYVWTILGILANFPLNILADVSAHRPFGSSMLSLRDLPWVQVVGFDLTAYPYLVPLWYVRCLFLLVLVSSAVAWLVGKGKIWFLLICFVAMVACRFSPDQCGAFFDHGVSVRGLLYFSVGIFICQNGVKVLSPLKGAIFAVGGVIVLAAAVLCTDGGMSQIFYAVAVPLILMATWVFMPAKNLPSWLTSCAFPIFLMHPLFLSYFGALSKHLNLVTDGAVGLFVKLAVCFVGPILVCRLLHMFMPRIASFLYGGR